jgi:hypothetical protein
MAGVDMAEAARAQVCILGSGTSLCYLSANISAHPCQVLGAIVCGRYIGESWVCR